ncbi:MAG TPA: YdbH domain-containing protein, partial [Croceibacterium sp.]|nr:YdbH domain-containing protein [Croceibacterium sp.]
AFRLADRSEPRRFNPLVAEGATLALEDNLITGRALLREPATGRAVTDVDLMHNLATGAGHADLAVSGLTFDDDLQLAGPGCVALQNGATPDRALGLSCRAFGVVSNLRGTVTGTGRVDWTETGITSRGSFSSESLDFAAAFGPVRGASGTVVFTDLLGLTTAPNQRLRVASINPGIEVTEGEVAIQVVNGEVLALQGATWPFMGGTLTMRPVEIRFGASEERRYVLEVEGFDAARFVEYMDLANMAATGIFDGTVPLVFDSQGNGHVVGGLLLSRPPGGNVSYVGQLTYEDMGAIANFAFDALRSLDYRQMRVLLDGDLTGEIVTRVRIDGVSQGEGASENFLTRKIAALPIRVDVNIRAPFYSLISNIKAMYDPAAIRDPRALGLIDERGNVIRRESEGPPPEPVLPPDPTADEAAIQRRESEEVP